MDAFEDGILIASFLRLGKFRFQFGKLLFAVVAAVELCTTFDHVLL